MKWRAEHLSGNALGFDFGRPGPSQALGKPMTSPFPWEIGPPALRSVSMNTPGILRTVLRGDGFAVDDDANLVSHSIHLPQDSEDKDHLQIQRHFFHPTLPPPVY